MSINLYLRYIGITPMDIEILREVRPMIDRHADDYVHRFYVHLKAFEGTRRFLMDESVVKRLLKAQREYVLSVFDAIFDEKYYQHRRVIGETHFRIGLDFKWYIGAYVLFFDLLTPFFSEHFANDSIRRMAAESAFRKALLLDMSIVLEAYHDNDKDALSAAQQQVLHQEKLAAVGLLASGLAHEIGNPLASIMAICDNQLRKSTGVDPQIIERFERIRDQVSRIVSIVRQLVSFARPGSSNWQSVNIAKLLEDALDIARLSRRAKNIDVKLELSETLPPTYAIADQLSQVFLNLFLNAIDATGEQSGRMFVRAYSNDTRSIFIEVQDNGCGMTPEQLTKIFAPFFTTKEVGKGTGLGLYVSYGIITRHNGRIEAASQPGQGTTFKIELPINAGSRNASGTIEKRTL